MALEIFKLVGSIFVDNEAANQSIQKTDDKAMGVGETLAKGIGTAAKWGAAIVGGATAAVTGITAFSKDTAAACDEIDKMSQKIGISREAYQEWDFILSQNGMDVNILQTGLKTMTNQMQAAANGTASAADAFKTLGISATDTNGNLLSSETVFQQAIVALQNMDNETERNAVANKLFGKSATELAPLLNAGTDALVAQKQQAHDLGLVLGDDTVDAGVKLTDAMDQLQRSFGAVKTNLGGALMPLVQKVVDYLTSNMPKLQSFFDKLSPVLTLMFDSIVPPLMDLAESLFPVILDILTTLLPIFTEIVQAVLPVIVELVQMLLPPIVEIVRQLLPPLLTMLQPLLDLLSPLLKLLQPILDLALAILDPIISLINDLLTPLISKISDLIGKALGPLKEKFDTVSQTLSRTFKAAVDLVMNQVKTIKNVFSGLIQFIKGVFTGDWKGAWEGVKKIFSSIWEGIKTAFKTPINWIIDGINAFIKGINKIKIPDWVPVVGGKGFSINTIPRLATGGVLEKGQTGFLEGNGAEAVVPLENNKKWIHSVAQDMLATEGQVFGGNRVQTLLEAILSSVNELMGMGVYLDTEALVGGIAKPMDRQLGALQLQKARA